jgi:hypothetical protein
MPQNEWTIIGTVGPGSSGGYIHGCHIVQNATATGYDFVYQSNTLASAIATAPVFTFNFNNFQAMSWSIEVDTLATGGPASGKWQAWSGAEGTDPDSGDWTAQAGAGGHPDPDEDAGTNAASASV